MIPLIQSYVAPDDMPPPFMESLGGRSLIILLFCFSLIFGYFFIKTRKTDKTNPLKISLINGILILMISSMFVILCSGSGTGLVYSLEEVTEGADMIAIARVKYEYTDYLAGKKITTLNVLGYLKNPQTLNELTFAYRTPIKIGPFWSGSTASYPTFQSGKTYILFISMRSGGYTLHHSNFGKYQIQGLDDPQIKQVQNLLGTDILYPVKTGISLSLDDIPALIIAFLLMVIYRNEFLKKG